MLKALRIENYAIIESVNITFGEGLNIITGETGAGKSILLGALGLVMGRRADTKALYSKKSKCIVEANFKNYPQLINEILLENDFDVEEDLIIRREITPQGKSRAFINDTPTKLDFLQGLALYLIDLNAQFEVTEIQKPKFQLSIIDALAKNEVALTEYKKEYTTFKKAQLNLKELEENESALLKEYDFLNYQYEELKALGLVSDEGEKLESSFQFLEKAEEIKSLIQETTYNLSESDINILDQINALSYKWDSYADTNILIKEIISKFENVKNEIDEIIQTAGNLSDQVEYDPEKLEEVKLRLDKIYNLQRKHNVQTANDLIPIYDKLGERIKEIKNKNTDKDSLKVIIEESREKLVKISDKLRERRKNVLPKFTKSVNEKLTTLAMKSAEIKVDFSNADQFRSDGMDELNFLFKSNKGGDFFPIKKVASGGESARLMLSIKATAANAMQMPTMIFDEIDTGVSGDVAGKMGDILKKLASGHQLICITHTPQVAARAKHHFFVHKEDKKDRTVTYVSKLENEARIKELAIMLSGNPPSDSAIANAEELISV